MANWSDLPEDLLLILLEKLDNLCDYIRFSGVCSLWRSIAKRARHCLRHQLPCLLLSSGKILPITQLQTSNPREFPALSLPRNSLCRGSYQGWLAMVNQDLTMHLQNPVSGQQIALPPVTTLQRLAYCYNPFWSIRKAFLSSEPISSSNGSLSSSCFVSVICQGDLFYCKLGDTYWAPIPVQFTTEDSGFTDATYHMGQFLALQSTGTLYVCDLNSSYPSLTKLDRVGQSWDHSYLVHCGGELFVVSRNREYVSDKNKGGSTHTTKIGVYKLDYLAKKWTEVKDLGGYALFLGYNRSFAMPATDLMGILPNHIYFTDDSYNDAESYWGCLDHDMGIYDVGSSKFKQLCPSNTVAEVSTEPSIWWVVPRTK